MDGFWGVTILLFIVLTCFVAAIVRVMSYYKKYHLVRHRRVCRSACPLKSGDVILFVAHTHSFVNSLFTGDLYTHGGVVVEMDGALYLSESTLDSVPGPAGEEEPLAESSQLNPLATRLEHYPGMYFVMPLERRLSTAQETVLRDRALVKTPYPGAAHILKALLRIPVHRQARHCMQHVAWLLDEVGLTPTDLLEAGGLLVETGFFRSSREVTTLSGRALGADGANRYGPVLELLLDA